MSSIFDIIAGKSALHFGNWFKNRFAVFDYIRAFLCWKEKRGKRSQKACGFTALSVRIAVMARSAPRTNFHCVKIVRNTALDLRLRIFKFLQRVQSYPFAESEKF